MMSPHDTPASEAMSVSPNRIAASAAALALAAILFALAGGCDDGQTAEVERLRTDLHDLQGKYAALTDKNERLGARIEDLEQQKAGALAQKAELEARLAEHTAAAAAAEARKEPPPPAETAAPEPEDPRLQGAREHLEKLAGALFARDDYDVALAVALVAAQLGSEDPETLFQIGFCRAAAGNAREARRSYERAVGILDASDAPDSDLLKKCLNNLAIACTRSGEAEKAERLYKRVLELDPEFAPAYLNLGLLYAEHLGRPEDAIEALRKHVLYGGSRSATARELIRKLQDAEAASPPGPSGPD